MIVFLISGYKGSGKDYFAEKLSNYLKNKNKTVKTYHFAEPLKEIVTKLLDIDIQDLERLKRTDELVYKNYTMRRLLQVLGTDILQKVFGKEIFANSIVNTFEDTDFAIIPDLRFLHEYSVISSKFKTITIEIKGLESTDTHPSEDLKALEHNIKYDYVFNNIDKNGYASDLKIKDFCDTIFKNIEEL